MNASMTGGMCVTDWLGEGGKSAMSERWPETGLAEVDGAGTAIMPIPSKFLGILGWNNCQVGSGIPLAY